MKSFTISRFDCDELDLISSKIVNQRAPEFVIGFYEEKLGWGRVRPGARVPRDLPELPEVPETPVVNPVIRNIKKDIGAADIEVCIFFLIKGAIQKLSSEAILHLPYSS